jgi:hypothetical protein
MEVTVMSTSKRRADPAPAPLAGSVRALLETMGGDPGAVARYLRDMGVRGDLRDPSSCAVAAFLSSVVGSDPAVRSIRVSHRNAVVRHASRWRWTVVPLPPPVRLFVAAFDAGAYPQLVRTTPPVSVSGTGQPVDQHLTQDGRA